MFSIVTAAGWPIWFLILASVVAVALILERFIALRRPKVLPPGLFDEVIGVHSEQGVSAEMQARLASSSPLGKVFAAGFAHEYSGRGRMKEAMNDAGHAVAHDLEKYLSGIGTVATVAPLMGLFGTCVGMIEIFGAQGPTGANPQQIAHGISVALYNTAFGILIAIPALIAYRHFRARVDAYLVEMEQQALRLVDALDDSDLLRPRATAGGRTLPRATSPGEAARLAAARAQRRAPERGSVS